MKTTIAAIFCFCMLSLQLSSQCFLACVENVTITTEADGTIELNIDDFFAIDTDAGCGPFTILLSDENGNIIESDTSTFTVDINIGSSYTYEISDATGSACWSTFDLVLGNGECSIACANQELAFTTGGNTAEIFMDNLLVFSTSNCTDFSVEIQGVNNTDFVLNTSDDSFFLSLDDDNLFNYTVTDNSSGNNCGGVLSLFEGCPMVCNELLNIATDEQGFYTVTSFMLLQTGVTCPSLQIDVVGVNNPDFSASGINSLTLNSSDDILLDFTVTNTETGVSCFGQIAVFDQSCQDTILIDLVEVSNTLDLVEVEVTGLDAAELSSLQFAMLYDGDVLSFAGAEPGVLDVGPLTFFEASPGDLRFLWVHLLGGSTAYSNNDVLFTVKFNTLSEGDTEMIIGADDQISPEATGPIEELYCIETGPIDISIEGAVLSGSVQYYQDFTCAGSNPNPIENILIEISDGSDSYFVNTDENGEYTRLLEPGNYTVTAFPLNSIWDFCENSFDITLANIDSELEQNFISNAEILCPFMEVDVSIPFVRRCFDNTYTVNYCNQGTANAENASIVIELQDNLIFVSADHPDYSVDGQFITFNLGTVEFGCETFTFVANADCDSDFGETHCVFAEIFPNDPCGRVLGEYDGAYVEINGFCDGDSVRVNISNTSSENMIMSELFIVVEEDVMLQAEPYQLNALSSIDLALPARGTTYWVNAEQPDGFPLAESASFSIEGCGVNEDGTINTGFINNFSLGDYYPYLDVDCQENIGAYDPNDKQVYPNGFGEEDFVKKNQTLDFKIRFQNTGTDTAFKVVVEDIISPYLDLSTLKRNSYSHRNTMKVDGRLLSFTFDNILLVDSLKNEPESHGFVSFSIDMMPDLEDGIEIENNADIFFDFNEPIRTNTTHLTIGTDFIDELSNLEEVENTLHIPVQISPNPAQKNTVLQIMSLERQTLQFSLYDIRGNKVIRSEIHENKIDLSSYALATGQYVVRLIAEDGTFYLAKVLVN